MSQIELVVNQIRSEFRLDNEGKAFVSIRGAARLADISQGGLSDSLKSGVQQKPTKLATHLMERGFEYVQQNDWSSLGIPDLALAAILFYYAYEAQERYRTKQAKLCCYAFESIGIRAWVRDSVGWKNPNSLKDDILNEHPSLPAPSVKEEIEVLTLCLSIGQIDSRLIAGVALNHAGTRMPQLEGAVNEGHGLLAAAGKSDLLLTPTKVGKEVGISARKVNEILIHLGYQVKNESKKSKTEPDYLVTEIGKLYADNTMATGKLIDGKADNTTYQHLKWKEDIIPVIQSYLAEQN